MLVRERLAPALAEALRSFQETAGGAAGATPPILLDVPPRPEMGDFTTGVALALARQVHRSPVSVAEELRANLQPPSDLVEGVDVSPSGLLTFRLRPGWQEEAVREALRQQSEYGRNATLGGGAKVLVEFVSANPTGPLTALHGRGAAFGDALSHLLSWTGHEVCREFYINDAGSQMDRFARALESRALEALGRGDGPSANGFAGPYVAAVAAAVIASEGSEIGALGTDARRALLLERGREAAVASQRTTLDRLGVRFDEWRSEQTLHAGGRLHALVKALTDSGHTYEADGAVWLRATDFGDTEDRPLLRGNGEATYLAADLAYHLEKFERGFDRLIDVWGPEHEGYIRRTRAGVAALGRDPSTLEIVILGDVSLRIDGMSVDSLAQKGSPLLLEEIIERVGPEAARLHFLSTPVSSPLTIDLDAARPVGANAPAQQLLAASRRAVESAAGVDAEQADLSTLTGARARALLALVAGFPDEVTAAAREREPHRLLVFGQRTAAALAALPAEPSSLGHAALAEAAGVVLANLVDVLGLSPA